MSETTESPNGLKVKNSFVFRKYGVFCKTLFKVLGRKRSALPSFIRLAQNRDIGIIGCGQFAFSTIGSVVTKKFSNRIVDAFDIDQNARDEFAHFFSINQPSGSARDLLNNKAVKYVYVVSNHATPTKYALEALAAKKIVYVEKPLAVSMEQLSSIVNYLDRHDCKLFVGYNRPFSSAVKFFKDQPGSADGPFTINAFISGHSLSDDHWYRREGEGNRVCGNMGHWIDLAVHLLSFGGLPDL